MPFEIRKFKKEDFETLWRIDQACFDPQLAYSRPELAFYMRRASAFTLVAQGDHGDAGTNGSRNGNETHNNETTHKESAAKSRASLRDGILGFIVADRRRQIGHIITIDVVEKARRLGVGSALLTAAEEQLRQDGATVVELETAINNEAAIRFYKGKGYFVEKTVAGYYSGQLDALVMEKPLVEPRVTHDQG
ncbi:MAG: N-acetyltransferase [Terriglobales bacterium]